MHVNTSLPPFTKVLQFIRLEREANQPPFVAAVLETPGRSCSKYQLSLHLLRDKYSANIPRLLRRMISIIYSFFSPFTSPGRNGTCAFMQFGSAARDSQSCCKWIYLRQPRAFFQTTVKVSQSHCGVRLFQGRENAAKSLGRSRQFLSLARYSEKNGRVDTLLSVACQRPLPAQYSYSKVETSYRLRIDRLGEGFKASMSNLQVRQSSEHR